VILLDTTILVYAVSTDDALRASCRELLGMVADGDVRAATTIEVIQEFTHVRARRRSRTDAAALARQYAIGLSPVIRPDDDLLAGLDLFVDYMDLGAFDAVLAATALRQGWAPKPMAKERVRWIGG
jgi:predicted nucleic acid-binding protein